MTRSACNKWRFVPRRQFESGADREADPRDERVPEADAIDIVSGGPRHEVTHLAVIVEESIRESTARRETGPAQSSPARGRAASAARGRCNCE